MTGHRRAKRGRTSPNPPAGVRVQRAAACSGTAAQALAPVAAPQPSLVMVAGLPPGCGVMELKSRLEAYGPGPIARPRIDAAAATGYVTFRSAAAAVAVIAGLPRPRRRHHAITVGSKKVLVVQASETPNNSKSVVRDDPAEATLHDETKNNASDASAIQSSKEAPEATYKEREIVAYDDLF